MISRFIVVLCLTALSACVYRVDVQQGNEITSEMVAEVEPGMTKREVVKILGYPLINDPFNKDRWDYYFSLKPGKSRKVTQRSSATLIFEGDSLKSIDAKLPAAESEG
ncbi:MAG: outer membrane protein assembly factor BamE [bacterium]